MERSAGERRRFPRYPIDVPVKLTSVGGVGKLALGRGTNLGQGGLEVVLAIELHLNQRVVLDLKLPYCSEPLSVEAEVCKRDGYRYGLAFMPMELAKKAVIKRVCDILALMFEHLERE